LKNNKNMVDVYASSVAKSVFVWICIVIIMIGYIMAIKNATRELNVFGKYEGGGKRLNYGKIQKTKEMYKVGKRAAVGAVATGVKFIPGVGTGVGIAMDLALWWKDYGGRIIFWFGMFMLGLIEGAWRPYRHLKPQ
jgi:hypothetical protein